MDTGTLIELITLGLPTYVSDRIDRNSLQETQDLYNEIGKLEHLANKKNFENKKNTKSYDTKGTAEKKSCTICKEKKKSLRYHPEHLVQKRRR